MSLGENIRRLRRDKGWTQGQLAERAGIKINHVSKMEQDDTDPKLSTLYKLMNGLGCSPDSLLMDVKRVTTDTVLKQTLERAMALPDDSKRALIEVVDKYCIASGFLQQFTPENKRPLGLSWYKDDPKAVLEDHGDADASNERP